MGPDATSHVPRTTHHTPTIHRIEPVTRRFTLLLLLSAPAALAAQSPVNDTAYHVAPVVVTAEREPLPAAAVSGSVTVLRGDEMRARGLRDVADALREVPGAAVVTTGSWGGQTSLFLRGGQSDYVKVLVDGVPMNQPGGAFDFGALTLDNVDRIEVVRGPASVLYGSDAVTGVIQIFTRRGAGRLGLDAAVRGGTFGTRRAEASLGAGNSRLDWTAGVASDRTDGTYAFNSGWRNGVLSASVGSSLDARTTARASIRYGHDDFHFPTLSDGTPADSNSANFRRSLALSAGVERAIDPTLRFALTGALSREDDRRTNDRDSPGDTLGYGFASRDQAIVLRRMLDGRLTLTPGARWSLALGTEYLLDQETRTPGYAVSNFGFGIDSTVTGRTFHTRRNIGTSVQALLTPSDPWSVSLGARLDDNEAFGQFFTSRAGVVRRFGDRFRVRGSVGTGFKTPTLEETYGNSAYSIGDPALKPEESTSWELGAERSLLQDRMTVGAVWFDQRFRRMIQYGYIAPGAPTYYNVAGATARGLDLTLSARPTRSLVVDGGYTFLATKVTDPGFSTGSGDVFVKGKELIRRPSRSGHLSVRYLVGSRAHLGGTVTHVGSRTDVDFGPYPSVRKTLPGYALVDVDADVEVLGATPGPAGASVALTLRVENAFDRSYQTVIGFPGRGRTLLGGARLHW